MRALGVPVLSDMPRTKYDSFDVIVDSLFGFSFDPTRGVQSPYDIHLTAMRESHSPVISVDIPSGWDVEKGDVMSIGARPSVLISLTAPKLCSKYFSGTHYIGGRFVPEKLAKKYNFRVPPYAGSQQFYKI